MKYIVNSEEFGCVNVFYYMFCFDRGFTLVFNQNIREDERPDISVMVDNLYTKWNNEVNDECCEEYIINNLSPYYRNNLCCVIFDDLEGEE